MKTLLDRITADVSPLYDATNSKQQLKSGKIVTENDLHDGYPHLFNIEPAAADNMMPVVQMGSKFWTLENLFDKCRPRGITPVLHYEYSRLKNIGMAISPDQQTAFLQNVHFIATRVAPGKHGIATAEMNYYHELKAIWSDLESKFGEQVIFISAPEPVAKAARHNTSRHGLSGRDNPLFDVPAIAFRVSPKRSKQDAALPDLDIALRRMKQEFKARRRLIILSPHWHHPASRPA